MADSINCIDKIIEVMQALIVIFDFYIDYIVQDFWLLRK